MKSNKKVEVEVPESEKPFLHENHSLKTRRDFLSQGFLGATAMTLAPTIGSLLASGNAEAAAECAVNSAVGLTPILILDLAGGGNIAGSNVMVGGQGGQLDFLPNYTSLGLPADMHPSMSGQTSNELGLVFHADSAMLRGIRSVTAMTTRNNCEGAVFCTSSGDDTSNNQHNPMYWLNKAGAVGTLNQLGGTSGSTSGGNASAPSESINPAIAPLKISSPVDAQNLVSLGRLSVFPATKNAMGVSKLESVLNTITAMSQKKLDGISRRSLPESIKNLVACGFQQTPDQVSKFNVTNIDPLQDPIMTAVFPNMNGDGKQKSVAPITKLVLDGYLGTGTITMGGFDYHNATRASGEQRDFDAGVALGRILETAARKQKDVIVYVYTDGGVASNQTIDNSAEGRGKFGWAGDSGQRSSTFMIVYKHDGRPNIRRADKRQIGWFKTSQNVENTAMLTSNSVVNTSKAIVANYLALHGMEGKLEKTVGVDPFRANLDNYLVFNKLR